jgi:hypothetical protein
MHLSALSTTVTQATAVVRPPTAAASPRQDGGPASAPNASPLPPASGAAPVSAAGAAGRTEAARSPEPARATPKLTPEQEAKVRELQRLDAEVRAHERAHAAVGGQYAGAPQYDTTRGPDGRLYAVDGRVSIDVSPVPGDPAATIEKMEVVKRAALAPMEPSGQDRRVAQKADRLMQEARSELQAQQAEARRAPAEAEGEALSSLMRQATGLYERAARAFAPPDGDSRTVATA